jgi:hypothetical protein
MTDDMEAQRDLFREAFMASNESASKIHAELRDTRLDLRVMSAKLFDSTLKRSILSARSRSQRRLLWVYGIWASLATVGLVWMAVAR